MSDRQWWDVANDYNLSFFQRAVLLCMIETCCAKREKFTLLSNQTIAERLGSTERGVKNAMRVLIAAGLVGKRQKDGKGRMRRDLLVDLRTPSERMLEELEEVAELKRRDDEATKYDWKV